MPLVYSPTSIINIYLIKVYLLKSVAYPGFLLGGPTELNFTVSMIFSLFSCCYDVFCFVIFFTGMSRG